MSQIGRRLMVPPLSLTVEACQQAVADAGLTSTTSTGCPPIRARDIAGMGEGGVTRARGALGLRPPGSTAGWRPSAPAVR